MIVLYFEFGVGIDEPTNYHLLIQSETVTDLDLDSSENFRVTNTQNHKFFRLEIDEPQILSINYKLIQEGLSIGTSIDPNRFLAAIRYGQVLYQDCVFQTYHGEYILDRALQLGFYVAEGTYYFAAVSVSSQTHFSLEIQEFSTESFELTEILAQEELKEDDFKTLTLENAHNETQLDGYTTPKFLEIDLPLSFGNEYQLKIPIEENEHIFNEKTTIDRFFYFDSDTSRFSEKTDFSVRLEMFDSDPLNDRFIFGIKESRIKSIDILLAQGATSNDFVWEYYRPSTSSWITFTPGEDSTHDGTTTLEQSGTIEWDANNFIGWNLARGDTPIPNTQEEYYWLAVRCTDADPETIPEISSQSYQVRGTYQRELIGNWAMHFGLVSPYDGSQVFEYARVGLPFTLTETFGQSFDIDLLRYHFGGEQGLVSLYVYGLFDTLNSKPFHTDLVVKLAGGERSSEIRRFWFYDIGPNQANATVEDLENFQDFDFENTIDASETEFLLYRVRGMEQFDWLRLNSWFTNYYPSQTIYIIYQFPWNYDTTPDNDKLFITYEASHQNISIEIGALAESFFVVFPVSDPVVGDFFNHSIWTGIYPTSILYANRTLNLPGFNWTLALSIGVPAGIGITVGVIVIVKKKRNAFDF